MYVQVHLDRPITDRELWRIGSQNPGWKVERVDGGVVMSPTTTAGGAYNARLTALLVQWGDTHGYVAFDSSAGIRMSNKKKDVLCPDGSLLRLEKWRALSQKERDSFARVDLDVVVEIVSKADNYLRVVAKCERWIREGAGYVALLDPLGANAQAWGTAPASFPTPEQLLRGIAVT
jgi:Uma2 family endonuclease